MRFFSKNRVLTITTLAAFFLTFKTFYWPSSRHTTCSNGNLGLEDQKITLSDVELFCDSKNTVREIKFVAGKQGLVLIENILPESRFKFEFQTNGETGLFVDDNTGRRLFSSFGTPTPNSGLATGIWRSDFDAKVTSIKITKTSPGIAVISRISIGNDRTSGVGEIREPRSDFRFDYILATFVILLVASVASLYKKHKTRDLYWLACICAFVFCITMYFGTPYMTGMSAYDTFDDTSYFTWAKSLGYHLKLSIINEIAPAARDNVHTWGTGLVYAPAFFLARLLIPNSGGTGFEVMSYLLTWIYILSILTCFFYYKAFSYFTDNVFAFILSICGFWGTSLIAWTFARNLFSHLPEAFALSMFFLAIIRIYHLKTYSYSNYILLAFAFILLFQIRREDAVFISIPIWLEWFSAKGERKKMSSSLGLAFVAVLGFLLLQSTNYLTKLGIFFDKSTAGLLSFESARILKNIAPVVTNIDSGLLAANIFLPLAILAVVWKKPKWYLALPGVTFVFAFTLMCLAHEYPNGVEWQNRFLLKLNPIIQFSILLLILKRERLWLKLSTSAVLVIGLAIELRLYQKHLPADIPDFANSFVTLALAGHAPIPVPTYVNLPIIFLVVLSVVLLNIVNFSGANHVRTEL